ncbi:hypothetical protein L207DRAFT_593635 [Hyaloscypha variabilis F]|uniref:Uncharacterized protein n=1 Tax=Hyaloscypha variabilis (strain UAMH 11265 / GT02V1 / F) TaxID=1149755 RepID=A0A2J6QSH5_HYAVF|nr:hypothetical protein L207DRAFT_593635 [Hyaloscypha variabilis F]
MKATSDQTNPPILTSSIIAYIYQYETLQHPWDLRIVELLAKRNDTDDDVRCKMHLTQQCAKEQDLVSNPQNNKKKIPYDGLPRTWAILKLLFQLRFDQIKGMMGIYETATKVVFWVSPEADESGLAIDRLNYLTGKALIELKPRESFDDLIERLHQDES